MWNLEKLLSVLVPSEKRLGECQNYATTLWNGGRKGKLCYQHPALTENKNRAEITSKSHSNEVRVRLIWQKYTRWNIYLATWAVTFSQVRNKSAIMIRINTNTNTNTFCLMQQNKRTTYHDQDYIPFVGSSQSHLRKMKICFICSFNFVSLTLECISLSSGQQPNFVQWQNRSFLAGNWYKMFLH